MLFPSDIKKDHYMSLMTNTMISLFVVSERGWGFELGSLFIDEDQVPRKNLYILPIYWRSVALCYFFILIVIVVIQIDETD